jgi:hypothetical protein
MGGYRFVRNSAVFTGAIFPKLPAPCIPPVKIAVTRLIQGMPVIAVWLFYTVRICIVAFRLRNAA